VKAKVLILAVVFMFVYTGGSAIGCLNKLGSSEISWATQEIQVSYPYAYLRCSGTQEIALMDISDPAKPKLLNSFHFKDQIPSSFHVEGDLVYAGSSKKFYCIDFSNIYNPTILGSVDTGMTDLSRDLEVSGNFAYLLYWKNLIVIDISNPASPSVVSNTNIFAGTSKMLVLGSTMYVTDQSAALLYSVDITDVSKPTIMDTISTSDYPVDLYAQDKVIYVADSRGGLQIFDISNPYELRKVSSLGFQKWVIAVKAIEEKVFLAWRGTDDDGGIYVIDVSDPTKPQLQFELQLYLYSYDLWLDSNKLYYLAHDGNFCVFDFSQCQNGLRRNAAIPGIISLLLYN
jgi:hypothetical protein